MKLIIPNKKYLKSYISVIEEYKKYNIETYYFSDPNEMDIFEKFNNYRNNINLKEGRVPQTTYWLVSDGEFLGEIAIRHFLNDNLLKYGGHIGYGIRKNQWNKGLGTIMLQLGLEKAKKTRSY